MKKIFRRTFTAFLILIFALSAAIAGAAVEIFDGEGKYIMSDFENHDIAKQRAQQRAEKDAQKKAGVALKTFSRSINSELTDNEVSAVTNNIIKVSDIKIVPVTFEAEGEAGLMYRATLKATIDTDGIYFWLKLDDKEKVTIIQQNTNLQDEIQKNDKQVEDLKEKYKRAKSQAEKDNLIKQMEQADKDFLANQKNKEGLKLHYAKNYEGAIKLYNEALQLSPNFGCAYNNLGWAYICLEKYDLAIENINKAIEFNPNLAVAYLNRSAIYNDSLGNYELAIQDCNKALELDPNLDMAYYNRGIAYANLGQTERAIKDYDKTLELNPNHFEAYNNRGFNYANLGQYNQAISDYSKAIQLNPDYVLAYINRGVTYLNNLGEYDKAIQDFDKVLEINPNNFYAYNNRGLAYYNLGQCERSIQDFDKAIQLNPKFPYDANINRGNTHLALKKYEKAVQDFNNVIFPYESSTLYKKLPFFINFAAKSYKGRAEAYFNQNQYEKAIQDFDKAIELNPNDAEQYHMRGLCYQKLGEDEIAQADFAEAKQLGYNG